MLRRRYKLQLDEHVLRLAGNVLRRVRNVLRCVRNVLRRVGNDVGEYAERQRDARVRHRSQMQSLEFALLPYRAEG